MLRSNLLLLKTMGADVWTCGPATLMPPGIAHLADHATTSIDEAVEGADVVMMLRIQHERMHGHFFPSVREYFTLFGLTRERLRRAADDVIVMHPGPMNRGVEIDSEVADGPGLGDPRAGVQRRRRADGGALSPGGPGCRRRRRLTRGETAAEGRPARRSGVRS